MTSAAPAPPSDAPVVHLVSTLDNLMTNTMPGGTVRYLNYAPHMRERGVQYHLLTGESDATPEWLERQAITLRVVPVSKELPLHLQREALLREAYRTAAQWPRGQRLVSMDSCSISLGTIRQLWGARLRGIPSSMNTAMFPGPLPTGGLRKLKLKLMVRSFLEGLAVFIPQTQSIRRVFADYFGMSGPRVQVLANGVNCDRYQPATAEQRAAAKTMLGLPAGAPVVVCVANVIPRKGIDLLVKAWPAVLRQVPEARLVIVGSVGPRATFGTGAESLTGYASEVQALADAMPIPDRVVLSGQQVDDVRGWLQAADVFAFASLQEGLPNAVLEAMACGLPCVLSAYEGFPNEGEEFGRHGEHYLRTTHEPEAIAGRLTELLTDEARRRAMGLAVRAHIEATQSLPGLMDRWAGVLRQAARVG